MGQEQVEVINAYLRKVESEWKTGQATEHTYRPMLKELLEHLLPKMMVINEPARIECGAPDYILKDSKTQLNICFIEAKDIGDADLDGKTVHKEQFCRYKDSLDSLCFTDYLDFRSYTHNDFIDSVRIAEIKGDRIVAANDAELERFLLLIGHLADAKPQHITSPSRLAALMAGKAKLLAQGVRHYLKNEANADSVLAQQMEAFRNVLIHDIDVDSFADLFAQTITYGMFAARLHDPTPEDFSRAETAQLIPKTNPLLRQMFQYIAMDADDSIEWIVDDLVALFAAVDVEKLMKGYGRDTQKSDPLLHFYEDFLAAYDPKLRKARGVWYTPKPIVDFIVRSVDHILEKDFGLPGGLADSSKVTVELKNDFKKTKFSRGKSIVHNEMHRVQILDPAAGTGTFLAEAVKRIHEKVVASMGEGAWQGYVGENLLPRLNGFEILMASYAMAHLKLDMLLAETGYSHTTNERLRVFLTNSLEPYDKETGTLFAAALSQEANEANFVKRDCPVMVVVGNPPYSGVSSNNGDWASHLIDDYKREPGSDQPLQERKHWLNDDYVKFLSFAQHYIDKNGEGIVGFINNNGFIDNPTFRGMRWSLLKSFDDIYIFNLHGNSMKKEIAPNGGKDENVFDIMVGVSINIFVRRKKMRNDGSLAVVHYADFYGEREEKYAFLDQNAIGSVKWQILDVQGPYFFFAPKDFGLQEEYEKGFRIDELMSVQSMSVLTARDDLVVDFTREELLHKIKYFADGARSDDEIRSRFWPEKKAGKYLPGDTRGWSLSDARKNVANLNHDEIITAIDYRPFDARFIYYSKLMVDWPRENVMRHLCRSGNLGLNVIRISTRDNHCALIATDKITDKTLLSSKDNANVFPLYLYDEKDGKVEKTPNFDAAIFEKIREAVGEAITPEDVFNYIYGVLHTPSYREKYREFLKIDFPRIPYPKSAAEFRRIAAVGEKLVKVHLLKDEAVTNPFANPYAKFEGTGDGTVEKVAFADEKVFINADQCFEPLPADAWNFYIGGYQPAQKWLKDRKGRKLSAEDVVHYKSIIAALLKTAALMKELEGGAQ